MTTDTNPAGNGIDTGAAQALLTDLASRAADPAPALTDMGGLLIEAARRNLEEGHAPDGAPHAPRRASHPVAPSALAASLASTLRVSLEEDTATVWSDSLIAAVFQSGARIPPRDIRPRRGKALLWPGAAHPVALVRHPGAVIPARPFLGADTGDLDGLAAILSGHLNPAGA